MKCTKCLFQTANNKAPQLQNCVICGLPLVPSVRDVLEHNCFGLVNETRPEQIRMSTDIDSLLQQDKGTLLAEGGTGLGKSYAYIIPALIRYIEPENATKKTADKFRVVIATAKKSLQAQLYSDLPELCKILGVPKEVNVVLYKGLNNYACWELGTAVPEYDRAKFHSFIQNAADNNHPADVVDWPGARPTWWDAVNLERCPRGVNCNHYHDCRPHVRDADIIVTNQHLLGLDLFLFQPGWLFGPYHLLIVDEAHHLAKALRDSLSSSLRPESIAKAARRLLRDPHMPDLIQEIGRGTYSATLLGNNIMAAHAALIHLVQLTAAATDTTHRYHANDFRQKLKDCHTLLVHALTPLLSIHSKLAKNSGIGQSLRTHNEREAGYYLGHETGYYLTMLPRLSQILQPLTLAKTFLEKHLDEEGLKHYITVSSYSAEDASLYITPINVGPIMRPILEQIRHKVFVSATLSLNGDFSYFEDDLGLHNTIRKVYSSPFNTERNVALYLPPWDMPQPAHGFSADRAAWIATLSREIRKLCNLTKGGTFVLFSATKDMDDVENHIGHTLENDGLELIVQRGDVTPHISNFRRAPNGVLFGLKSIWEGIDIVGDQLRCVIIPKLPFPNPNDPVIASKSELATANGDNAFARVSLPAMFTDMRQGTGRLIRSTTDKGIIAILDTRIWTGGSKDHAKRLKRVIADPDHKRLGYGKDLLDILGFTTLTNDFTRLGRWYMKTFKSLNNVNTIKEGDPQDGTSKG